MEAGSQQQYFTTGGTLRADAPSYVERQADRDLLAGLLGGEFCYVLTSRQMGKSSLMVRTAQKLRARGIQVLALDLTAVGQNLTPEQWYDGLMLRVAQQCNREDEMESYWAEHQRVGPCQRFFSALRDLLLPPPPAPGTPATPGLVIFIDELDTVRSLPFSTDEFFAAIRECYNRRTEDPSFQHLTFCLLGVATPADLIRDPRITPFNIGHRIELNDFDRPSMDVLAQGLGRGLGQANPHDAPPPEFAGAVLDRVYHWTRGHPYLTQRLCRTLAESLANAGPDRKPPATLGAVGRWVDDHCYELFLSRTAKERDDNLIFVRERLLRSEADLSALLDLYIKVWNGRLVVDDETEPLVSHLKLSGIVRVRDGRLKVRNRVYARVFDRRWATTSLPQAELRRQREAYFRGLVRAASAGFLVILAVSYLGWIAMDQSTVARTEAENSRVRGDALVRVTREMVKQWKLAETNAIIARRNAYAADMNLAHQALENGDVGRAKAYLSRHQDAPEGSDIRGWEWRYLWLQTRHEELALIGSHSNRINQVALSRDGNLLASAGLDSLRLWDMTSRSSIAEREDVPKVTTVAFSPSADLLVAAGFDKTYILETPTLRDLLVIDLPCWSIAFSPDGSLLATASGPEVVLWDVSTRQVRSRVNASVASFAGKQALAFSPDGRTLAIGSNAGDVLLWQFDSTEPPRAIYRQEGTLIAVAFSPDGRWLASATRQEIRIFDVQRGTEIAQRDYASPITSLAFSKDGERLATGIGHRIQMFEVPALRDAGQWQGHMDVVESIVFSPRDGTLISSSRDETIRQWAPRPRRGRIESIPLTASRQRTPFQLTADGRWMRSINRDGSLSIWETARLSERRVTLPEGLTNAALSSVASNLLAFLGPNNSIVLRTLNGNNNPTAGERILTPGPGPWTGLLLSPDASRLALLSPTGVELINLETEKPYASIKTDVGPAGTAAFSPDGSMLATSGQDDWRVRVWSITDGRELASFSGHKAWVTSIAFHSTPERSWLATASLDGTARLWDLRTRSEISLLRGSASSALSLSFSPDGRRLAVGTYEGAVQLWDTESYYELITLAGQGEPIFAVAFLGDGETLVAASPSRLFRWRASINPVGPFRFRDRDRPFPVLGPLQPPEPGSPPSGPGSGPTPGNSNGGGRNSERYRP